jgi:hypothetical protein
VRELIRERERQEAPGPRPGYELCFERRQTFVERQHRGTVIVWPHEREWDVSRQGKIMWFLHPGAYKDTCLQDWYVLVQEIPVHAQVQRIISWRIVSATFVGQAK